MNDGAYVDQFRTVSQLQLKVLDGWHDGVDLDLVGQQIDEHANSSPSGHLESLVGEPAFDDAAPKPQRLTTRAWQPNLLAAVRVGAPR
jgi:hypothetical protein